MPCAVKTLMKLFLLAEVLQEGCLPTDATSTVGQLMTCTGWKGQASLPEERSACLAANCLEVSLCSHVLCIHIDGFLVSDHLNPKS